jgi:hypothetical protein
MLIKNRSRAGGSAVIMVTHLPLFLLIATILSLANTFIPFLWAVVITARHMLRRRGGRLR